jgi:hypothetical protein
VSEKMVEILAIRDNETGTVVELRELPETEDVKALYAAKRAKYPPPRFELVIGMAASLAEFLKGHPRFKRGGGGGDGDSSREPAGGGGRGRPDSGGRSDDGSQGRS